MHKISNNELVGKVIGAITVLGIKGVNNHGETTFLCLCDCGKQLTKSRSAILRMKGAGCEQCKNKAFKNSKTKHGHSDCRLHIIWMHMRTRCNKPTDRLYNNYGGRGIRVCKEWEEFLVFYNWAINNGYSEKLTLDRYPDVNGNYEPSNCRWATSIEQNNNRRNNNHYMINGVSKTIRQWCIEYNVSCDLVRARVKRGIDIEKALTLPKCKAFEMKKLLVNPAVQEQL